MSRLGLSINLARLDRTVATITDSGAATPAKELGSLTDTADLYATATGLVERPSAAYASGLPEDAGDDGFFGPASVTWRMSAELASPVAALRSLLMQALHPLAMTDVDQDGGWCRDPVGRLAATMAYLTTVTFGDRALAMRAAARVRCVHDHVRGTDAVTGPPYAAGDPALLLWVHGALVDSVLAAGNLVGTALSAADSNRYVAEMVTAAELTGVPRRWCHPTSRGLTCTSRRSGPACAARLRPPNRWPACWIHVAWMRTPRRSGRTSATPRSPCSRVGRGRCTASA